MFEELQRQNFGIKYKAKARVDQIDKELLEIMVNAGVDMIHFGVESVSQKSLTNMQKRTKKEDIRRAFEVFGKVDSVSAVRDESAGESTDNALVEMPSDQEALAAISGLSDTKLKGHTIQVNEARTGPKDRRRPGRGGGRRKDDPKPGEQRR